MQLVGGENIDDALATVAGLQQVVDVEHRLADEFLGALLLERKQAALDRADRRGRHVAVAGLEFLRVVADVLQHRAQVLEIEQQQPAVVGDLEDERQHALLRVVQHQDPREQQRAQIRDRRANRVALLAEDVPEDGRTPGEPGSSAPIELQPLVEFRRRAARLRDAGEIAFDVGHEHRYADPGKALGHDLQRDGLAGSGGPGDEAVPVGERRQQAELDRGVLGNRLWIGHQELRCGIAGNLSARDPAPAETPRFRPRFPTRLRHPIHGGGWPQRRYPEPPGLAARPPLHAGERSSARCLQIRTVIST